MLLIQEAVEPVLPGTLVIQNRDQIDGQPLTIGETLTLQASALTEAGEDISAQIQWTDQEGNLLGSGGSLTYTAAETQMLTITASAGGKRDRVSFTVSMPDAVIQPHVKVLAAAAADNLVSLDWTAGTLELVDDLDLTTIQVGDVIEGAGFQIPPVRVLTREKTEDHLQLGIEIASPRDVIQSGVISEWQEVQLGENGELVSLAEVKAGERVSLASDCTLNPISQQFPIPVYSSPAVAHEIQIPNPWSSVKRVNASLTTALDVEAVTSVYLCPVFEPPYIEFHEEGNLFSGIRKFEVGAGMRDAAASAYLQMNGLLEWGFYQRIPEPPKRLLETPPFFVGQLGPVSIWVSFNALASVQVEAGASLSMTNVRLGVEYSGGTYVQRISYEDDGESGRWSNEPEFTAGSFSEIREGELDLNGYLEVGLNPEIEPEIWGSPPGLGIGRVKLFKLPKVGLYAYLRGELDLVPDDVGLQITAPTANTTLDGNDEITLQAEALGDPELRLLAGLDFTIRDGSVECPDSESSSLVGVSLTSSCEVILAGGINEHEKLGGHTKRKHIEKEEIYLRNRLVNERVPFASTFSTYSEAQSIVNEVLSQSQNDICLWLDDKKNKLPFIVNYFPTDIYAFGKVVAPNIPDPVPGDGVHILLQKSCNSPIGFVLIHAYPILSSTQIYD